MLKFQIDSLEGVDATLHSFYDKTDTGYRLKVDGLEDTNGLKTALQKEREGNKEAKSRLAELEKLRQEDEQKLMESQGKYKELSEAEKQRRLDAELQFTELQKKVASSKRDLMLRELASSLTADPLEQEIISRFAVDYVKIEGEEVTYSEELEGLKTKLSKFVRSKAQGDNDGGNNRGGGDNKIDISKLTPAQMMRIGREQKK
jgi:hypothetical protein